MSRASIARGVGVPKKKDSKRRGTSSSARGTSSSARGGSSSTREKKDSVPPEQKERDPSAVLQMDAEEAAGKTPNELFAYAIACGATQSDAARIAGCHPSNATNFLRQEEVKEMIAAARAETSEITTLKRMDVLNMFLEAIDMARVLADPGQMINGADKIAKMMGYYAPEVKEININDGSALLQRKFKQMTDAELLKIASGEGEVLEGSAREVNTDTQGLSTDTQGLSK